MVATKGKPDKRTLTYAGKKYKIEIEHIDQPPYGVLYINKEYRGSVFPSITHQALIQYIQQYNKVQKYRKKGK